MKFLFRGISLRITSLVSLLCLGFAAVSWWQMTSQDQRLRQLHLEAEQQAAIHLDGLLELESQAIRSFSVSYSWWDELVAATEATDQKWLKANIDPALNDYQLDAAIILNHAGVPIHTVGIDLAAAQRIVATLDLTAIRTARTTWSHALVDGDALDIAGATIHPTADTTRMTEPHGILLGVRRWSSDRADKLARLFGGSLSFSLSKATAEPPYQDLTRLHLHRILTNPAGRDVAAISAIQPMPALEALIYQGNIHLLLSASFGICALFLLSAFGMRLVGQPLKLLAKCVQLNDADAAHNLARRQDELGLVANAVVQSIDHQTRLSKEVDQRRQAETSLREANAQLNADLQRREQAEQALREAEQRNALALQGGNLCLWELFLTEGRWATDRSWLAFLGVTLDPSVPDTTAWEAVVAPEGMKRLHERIAMILVGTTTEIEATFGVLRDDGGRVWVLLRGMVVERDLDGVPIRLAGTMLDVTHWREMEEQLQQSQKLESIGQLAAGIAHEINTPIQFIGDNTRFTADCLTTLMTFAANQAAIAASHPDPEARRRAADAAEGADFTYLATEVPKAIEQTLEGINRVATIVRAMKEFSHPGSTELTPCDLNHLIKNAVIITNNTWKYVAELSMNLEANLPPIPLVASDFNQVLLNLIVNSAHAIEDETKKGKKPPGKIHIVTSRTGDLISLSISDDGCGIPEDIRARIYDPFFTTKEVGRGSGQGLTIARSIIVDRHHGSITCESEVGIGTVFTILLPLTQPGTDHD